MTPMIKTLLRKNYDDLALMGWAARERSSKTVGAAPPRRTDRPAGRGPKNRGRTNLKRGLVSARDVAHVMIRRALEQPDTKNHSRESDRKRKIWKKNASVMDFTGISSRSSCSRCEAYFCVSAEGRKDASPTGYPDYFRVELPSPDAGRAWRC